MQRAVSYISVQQCGTKHMMRCLRSLLQCSGTIYIYIYTLYKSYFYFNCSSFRFIIVLGWTGIEVIQRKITVISLTLNAIFMLMMPSCKTKLLGPSWSIRMCQI